MLFVPLVPLISFMIVEPLQQLKKIYKSNSGFDLQISARGYSTLGFLIMYCRK